jgi:hypothetical protein
MAALLSVATTPGTTVASGTTTLTLARVEVRVGAADVAARSAAPLLKKKPEGLRVRMLRSISGRDRAVVVRSHWTHVQLRHCREALRANLTRRRRHASMIEYNRRERKRESEPIFRHGWRDQEKPAGGGAGAEESSGGAVRWC